jgi:GNAT superfamily N-acetyltransferase
VSERVTLRLLDAHGLAPYARDLVALEASLTYPVDDGADRFAIDHGPTYHPFFSALGDPRFLLALDGDRVVGAVAGVFREARDGAERTAAVYLCDLKVAASHRGTGLARRMAAYALAKAATEPDLWRWRLAYAAAMRDARGDVTRSMRGAHAGRLLAPAATLAVYFVKARALAALDPAGCPAAPDGDGLDLSPTVRATARGPGVTTTAGRKDLRLVSTGAPWPLAHLALGPGQWGASLGAYLRACGEFLGDEGAPEATACFTLDARLAGHSAWLTARGVSPGAACTVYTFRLGLPARRARVWVHLSPSEI